MHNFSPQYRQSVHRSELPGYGLPRDIILDRYSCPLTTSDPHGNLVNGLAPLQFVYTQPRNKASGACGVHQQRVCFTPIAKGNNPNGNAIVSALSQKTQRASDSLLSIAPQNHPSALPETMGSRDRQERHA